MFKIIKAIFTAIGIMLAGMRGGQKDKGTRRYGIPGIAIFSSLGKKFRLKHLAFLLFIPTLSMGYGENSILFSFLKFDFLVRIIYGVLLSVPFIFFGRKRWLCAVILLPIAFSIHAGSLGHIWGMDILVEDILRYSCLGVLVAYNIFAEKT